MCKNKIQNSKSKIQKLEKGVSIYLVILISTFILAVALGLSTILISRIKVSQEIGYSVVAFYAADTGIERILYDIRKLNYECSSPPCTPYSNIPLDSASYGVVINSWSPSVQINSTGKYQTVKRAIEINY
jgi:hypothetical protein